MKIYKIFIRIFIIITIVEFVIMEIFSFVKIDTLVVKYITGCEIGKYCIFDAVTGVIDAVLLSLISFPFIYFYVIRIIKRKFLININELILSKTMLTQSEENFSSILRTVPDIIYEIDTNGKFIFVNNAISRLGYKPEELIGEHFSKIILPEDIETVSRDIVLPKFSGNKIGDNKLPKLFDERRADNRITTNLEVRVIKKNTDKTLPSEVPDFIYGEVNSTGVFKINPVSLKKEYGGSMGVIVDKRDILVTSIGVIRDVTEQTKMKKKLIELNYNLEEIVELEIEKQRQKEEMLTQQSKLASMGEMINSIAHQWRQPLNAAGLIVQDLAEAYKYGEVDEKYMSKSVEMILEQIYFMSNTIDDFRNFFKPSKEKTNFDIIIAVNKTISLIGALLKNKSITINVKNITMDSLIIFGYENELKQVFLNILNNAKDVILGQIESGSVGFHGEIGIEIYRKDTKIVIEIEDNGGGIPEEIMDKIFGPYFTTKEKSMGTGIGLYMSKIIVEEHFGGSLSVNNTKTGAIFRIELEDIAAKDAS